MNKKIIILLAIILVFIFCGLFFYFCWQGGPELRRLNKTLPEGIRVEKRGNQQIIINDRDNYKIKIPREWGGIKNLDYTGNNLGIGGKKAGWITIVIYKVEENININNWFSDFIQNPDKNNLTKPKVIGKERVNDYEVIKIKDFGGVLGDVFFYYFKSGSKIYELYSESEKYIQNIILNGEF